MNELYDGEHRRIESLFHHDHAIHSDELNTAFNICEICFIKYKIDKTNN